MDHITSSPNTEKEVERAEIGDLVQALHTFYEFANMPSMMIRQRRSNGEDIPVPQTVTGKSTSRADTLLNYGYQAFFIRNDYEEAVFAYTECLRYAEEDSEIVALAYVSRSVASFELHNYLECKNDITRALLNNKFPEDKRETLHEIYQHCVSLMDNPPNPASDAVASSSKQEDVSQEKPVEVDARILIKEEIDEEWREMCVDLTNPLLRRTSNKIRLECNETWGRHMVASNYIKAGEILSCERFFSMFVPRQRKQSLKRCSYCYSVSYALVPCNLCSTVMYCSTYCKIRAFNLFHRIECCIIRSQELHGVQDEECTMMALRMLLVGTDQGAGLETLMKKMTMRDIFAEKIDPTPNKPFSSDYSDVLKLMRTFPKPLLCFNSKPGLVVRMILALQNTDYFGQRNERPQKRLTDTELFTALLLSNHILSIQSSVFYLCEYEDPQGTTVSTFGRGIPILHNMINHSCNPNAFYLSRYNETALFAIRPISKDEQIFITYSDDCYFNSPLRERQVVLASQLVIPPFTCKCEACIEDWPTDVYLEDKPETFLGTSNVEAAVKQFDEKLEPILSTNITEMSLTEIRHVMSRVGGWIYHNLALPSVATFEYQDICKCFVKYLYDTFRSDTNKQDLMKKEVVDMFLDIKMHVHTLLRYKKVQKR